MLVTQPNPCFIDSLTALVRFIHYINVMLATCCYLGYFDVRDVLGVDIIPKCCAECIKIGLRH
jgi:hypothetical protein